MSIHLFAFRATSGNACQSITPFTGAQDSARFAHTIDAAEAFALWAASPQSHPPLPAAEVATRRGRASGLPMDHTEDSAPADEEHDTGSLLYARIAGARAVLGNEAHHDDDALLIAANGLHRAAIDHPDEPEAQATSNTLWRAEAAAWASANGASPNLDEETRLKAYLHLWTMVLAPPPAPQFTDRREIAKQYVLELAATGQSFAIRSTPSVAPVPIETLIDRYMDDAEVISRYYGQFATYAESHLDQFGALGVVSEAARAGMNRLRLEEKPQRMWHISSLSQLPAYARALPSGALLSALLRRMGESHVAQMENGDFFHIDATGSIERLTGPIVNQAGQLDMRQVLKSRGIIKDDANEGNAVDPDAEPAYLANWSPCEPVRLIDHAVPRRVNALREVMAEWKKEQYLPSRTESVMRLLIPFYEVYHNKKWDPSYSVTFEDIAWDTGLLVLTVAGILVTAMGGSVGLAAATQSIRAAASQGVKAMIKAGITSLIQRFNLRVLLVQGGRELADFVLPITPMVELAKGTARAVPAAARTLRTAVRDAEAVLRGADPKILLDFIYDVIARTGGLARSTTAQTLRVTLQTAAKRHVPARIYRGQSHSGSNNTLYAASSGLSGDDLLIEYIKRAAAKGGGRGNAPSLTADRSVAVRLDKEHPKPNLLTIDTTQAPGQFRTLEDILLNDGPRLVQQGKIRAYTLRSAILHAYERDEKGIYYMGGEIPAAWIDTVKPVGDSDMAISEAANTAGP